MLLHAERPLGISLRIFPCNSSIQECIKSVRNHAKKSYLAYENRVKLHLLRVELRCKLPGKLHRVTGPLAHDVVLNHTFELLINIFFDVFEMSI